MRPGASTEQARSATCIEWVVGCGERERGPQGVGGGAGIEQGDTTNVDTLFLPLPFCKSVTPTGMGNKQTRPGDTDDGGAESSEDGAAASPHGRVWTKKPLPFEKQQAYQDKLAKAAHAVLAVPF